MASPTDAQDAVLSCHGCGASVYKEHLDKGLAGYHAGKLLCVYCMKETRSGGGRPAESPPASIAAAGGAADETSPISLVDASESTGAPGHRTIHGTSMSTAPGGPIEESARLKRPLNKTGAGASRCRVFHSKLSDEATRHMEQQINEWLDRNPDVEIKFCTSTVGVWTGKHAEPNLILTMFY